MPDAVDRPPHFHQIVYCPSCYKCIAILTQLLISQWFIALDLDYEMWGFEFKSHVLTFFCKVSKYDLVLSSSSIKTTTVKQEYGFKFMPIRKQVGSNSTDGMLENNLG